LLQVRTDLLQREIFTTLVSVDHEAARGETAGMRVLFYGRLAETIAPEIALDVAEPTSVADLRQRLAIEHPAAAATLRSARALACVDGTLVRDDHVVAADQTLEFLPPLSGG
jgi:molybdopterin converting factor small subunit